MPTASVRRDDAAAGPPCAGAYPVRRNDNPGCERDCRSVGRLLRGGKFASSYESCGHTETHVKRNATRYTFNIAAIRAAID
jgi:hypothetical protein